MTSLRVTITTLVLAALLATPAGASSAPAMVSDVNANAVAGIPQGMTAIGGKVYFSAIDPGHGRELWLTDGTPGGTTMVRDIKPGSGGSSPHNFTDVNGTVFFVASDGTHGLELWKTNGTHDGTEMVEDLEPGPGPSHVRLLVNFEGTLLFGSTVGPRPGTRSLYQSDGTAPGTFPLKEVDYAGSLGVD